MLLRLAAVVAAVSLTCFAGEAYAQAESSAPAAAPSPRALELAGRLVAQTQSMDMEAMVDAMLGAAFKDLPADDADHNRKVQTIVSDLTKALLPRMMDTMGRAMAETYTEQELEALVAFNESELGRSINQKAPKLAVRSMTAMQTLMPQFRAEMTRRMCSEFPELGETPVCSVAEKPPVA